MPLTVSTQCPSCGGALDYTEGSNAVHCGFCGSSHVVTGRGRVLSYYIPEKVTIDKAAAFALAALKGAEGSGGWRVRETTLFFVPFLHYTGQDMRWEVQEVEIAGGDTRQKSILTIDVRGYSFGGFGGIGGFGGGDVLDSFEATSQRITEKRFELETRYIDRSFPALEAPDLGVFSLGLRPEILKLSLFEKQKVAERGMLAPVGFTAAQKEEMGYAPLNKEDVVARRVFGKSASVIYFPFWIVEVVRGSESALSVVDGVSGEVPNPKAPTSLLDALVDKDGQTFDVAALRPLKCPVCAADLPVKPNDAVFICPGCRKAWYINGSELTQVHYTVVPPKLKRQSLPVEYFPYWVVRADVRKGGDAITNKYDLIKLSPGVFLPKEEDKAVPLRFFVPAFRLGSMNVLSRLAMSFTRNQPEFEGSEPDEFVVRGSYLSPEDALTLAPLVLFSLVPKGNKNAVKFALESVVEPILGELVMIPYYKGRMEYTDALFGWTVPVGALRD